MNQGIKGACAAALSLTLLISTLTACGKKIERNPNTQSYITDSSGNYSNDNNNNVMPADGNNTANIPNNGGDSGFSDTGGNSSGGYIANNSSSAGSYTPADSGNSNNYNPVTDSPDNTDANDTTKKSSVFDRLKRTTTTTTATTSRTTRPITSNPVNAQRVLNSASLKPMVTNDAQLDNLVNEIIANYTNSGMSTYQKVCSIYDHFVMDNRYGFMPLKTTTASYYSIYDADVVGRAKNFLIYKTGDCFDFSAAFMAVTRKLGLESYLINGQIVNKYGDTSIHGWTIIRINGVDYGFDPEADFRYANGKAPSYWNFCIDDPVKFKKIYTNFAVASFMKFKTF